ncbi:hydroxyacylglutathione hydrolase [Ochrobactrum sp. POC9]|uniref:FAD/NAD(P)-binding protein n=1 Tax=unclassified Ochrobactrum TaxID=239106 RepID=UPI000D706F11|nr:FAD/NAD(P)-binding protein [Ochrobactrum sp. POC9]MCH4542224.1 FAD/NAD(P)-binding protein [Ochrobactrum sp. A-1]PWU72000.1 hydroxyacylglutathione hydrolase [Ochrobactrum sp. POC9]
MKSFIIIGAGASGIILAAQLLRRSPESNVRIFERSGQLGAGIAYATENPSHLLNVRASNMSAYPDQPDHFLNWLRSGDIAATGHSWEPHSFAPRKLYRSYLEHLIAPYLSKDDTRLTVEKASIIDIALKNGRPAVTAGTGDEFIADAVIVATGNEAAIAKTGNQITEYWSSNGYFDVPADAPVAIFGTGLSMVDSVLSLLDNGHNAEIYAISRRGLLPASHAPAQAFPIAADDLPVSLGLSKLMQRVRALMVEAEKAGSGWRGVMDGLRPHTQHIWAGLPTSQRRSFLRHLRPWWDVHRHRMAPAVADRIEGAMNSGQLKIAAGHLVSVRDEDNGIEVRYRPRRGKQVEKLHVTTVIDCRGGNPRFSTTRNAALIGLMEHGLARPDALDLGFDVTRDLQVLNARGEPSGPFFAIGPVTKGAFWEVTAVPDIRVQAERLSAVLLEG